jgi:hypothetical protein
MCISIVKIVSRVTIQKRTVPYPVILFFVIVWQKEQKMSREYFCNFVLRTQGFRGIAILISLSCSNAGRPYICV